MDQNSHLPNHNNINYTNQKNDNESLNCINTTIVSNNDTNYVVGKDPPLHTPKIIKILKNDQY